MNPNAKTHNYSHGIHMYCTPWGEVTKATISVERDGSVLVWDDVAKSFTRCHRLTPREERKARRRSVSALVRGFGSSDWRIAWRQPDGTLLVPITRSGRRPRSASYHADDVAYRATHAYRSRRDAVAAASRWVYGPYRLRNEC